MPYPVFILTTLSYPFNTQSLYIELVPPSTKKPPSGFIYRLSGSISSPSGLYPAHFSINTSPMLLHGALELTKIGTVSTRAYKEGLVERVLREVRVPGRQLDKRGWRLDKSKGVKRSAWWVGEVVENWRRKRVLKDVGDEFVRERGGKREKRA